MAQFLTPVYSVTYNDVMMTDSFDVADAVWSAEEAESDTEALVAWLAEQTWSEFAQSLVAFHIDRGFLTPKQIESAKSMRAKTAAKAAAAKADPGADVVPEGRYAVELPSDLAFFKVDRPTTGKWDGHVFVKRLVGAPDHFHEIRLKKGEAMEVLDRIAKAGAIASAKLFSRKHTVCSRCLSPLSLVQSRATGFGRTCAGHIGVHYLSRSEALKVLKDEGISLSGLEDLDDA